MDRARAAKIEARKEAVDRWVAGMGGYAGARYGALRAEALEFAGADGCAEYLDMARQIDEEHAAGAGRWLAAEIDLANTRAASRRADAAATAVLRRSNEIELAAQRLTEHLGPEPDFSTRAEASPAEAADEVRAMLGLARRLPDAYRAELPPVAGLARAIGVKW
jgi:hypothetical protein